MKRHVAIALDNEFVRFLAVGGTAAAVNFLSRIAYNQYLSFRLSVIIAYVTGMITAYLLTRQFVFERSGRHPAKEFYYFTLVNLGAVLLVWLISVGLAEYLFPTIEFGFYPYEVAHLIGISVPAITSYLGHKYLSFRKIS